MVGVWDVLHQVCGGAFWNVGERYIMTVLGVLTFAEQGSETLDSSQWKYDGMAVFLQECTTPSITLVPSLLASSFCPSRRVSMSSLPAFS